MVNNNDFLWDCHFFIQSPSDIPDRPMEDSFAKIPLDNSIIATPQANNGVYSYKCNTFTNHLQ